MKRKSDEQTKELSDQKLRMAVETSSDAFYTANSEGVFTFINQAFTSAYGYEFTEVVGKMTPEILFTGNSPKADYDVFRKELLEGRQIFRKVRYKRRNGDVIDIEETVNPITDESGSAIGFVGVQRDIASKIIEEQKEEEESEKSRRILLSVVEDQKIAREELRKLNEELEVRIEERTKELSVAQAEAEQANRSKSEFLANMSHEIRTPLNAVLGYADLLVASVEDKTHRDYANSIQSSGRGLLTIINDILDLSKIEAGRLDLEFDYINTKSFFEELRTIFQTKIAEKGLDFILDISSGVPAGLYVDETRLRQVIFNVAGNAIKFTESGYVKIAVSVEYPKKVKNRKRERREAIDLVIEVADSGIGISDEFKERIFSPFTQQRGQKRGGTGLGMTITKKLLSLMNGIITLKSELNKGSTFKIVLPDIQYLREYDPGIADIQIDIDNVVFEETRLLIIDDIDANRKYIIDALKETNIEVFSADNGLEGLNMIKEINPGLVLTDIRMPVMNGFELLEKVKEDKEISHIPVIAYTASVMQEQRDRIKKSLFAGFIAKPVRLTELYVELLQHIPYSLSDKNKPGPDIRPDANIKDIVNLNGLISALESTFMEKWKTIEKRQQITVVIQFGNELTGLGSTHNAMFIIKYGEALVRAAEEFNVKGILELVRQYPGLVSEIRYSL